MSAQAAALALHSQSPGIEAARAGSRPRPVRILVDWTLVNDEVLVHGCVSQDDDAYAELVRRYEGSLFNVAYRLLGRYDEATDATQQALVQAYVALPTSRLGLPVRPWLFRILRNHCIDRPHPLSAGEGDVTEDTRGAALGSRKSDRRMTRNWERKQ